MQTLQKTGDVVQGLCPSTDHGVARKGGRQEALVDKRFKSHDGWIVCANNQEDKITRH